MINEVKNYKFTCDHCQAQAIMRDVVVTLSTPPSPPGWTSINHDDGAGHIKVENRCKKCSNG